MWWSRHTDNSKLATVDPGERVRRMVVEELSLRGHSIVDCRLSRSEWLEVNLRVSQRILSEFG